MSQYRGILDLSNELLQLILDHIAADPDKAVGIDRREYLSQESFGPPPRPSPNQIKDIGEFRVTCRRFSKLAAPLLFSRFTTRFSQTGLARLDGFSEQRHLASHVKKFSYMVPCFYTEGIGAVITFWAQTDMTDSSKAILAYALCLPRCSNPSLI